ncbi:MAG: D-cysteine desulfhydrase family protein [Anaerolineales bacterium]|nr:D-cysteine desulfhydrase family protein [Anaerolineales bacterium]
MRREDELRSAIARLPRIPLGNYPTPLEPLPRLSATLGGPLIYLKRDDLTGLAFGGNKTRMLEFSLADALAKGAEVIVTGMAVQSNYCRQLAAACARVGLPLYLVLRAVREIDEVQIQGNHLLQRLFGAHIEVVPNNDRLLQRERIAATADRLRAEGKRVYVPRQTDTVDLDAIAYIESVLEMQVQCRALGTQPQALYLAAADTTQAGIVLAHKVLRTGMPVRGVNPFEAGGERITEMLAMARQAATRLGLEVDLAESDFENDTGYVGERYGIPTAEGLAALHLVARQEGILLDPVYTSKAMAALIADIAQGKFLSDAPVLFLHTGGAPAIFGYADDILASLPQEPG